jgi:two-component system nitrate/nitrite response regulator NarL
MTTKLVAGLQHSGQETAPAAVAAHDKLSPREREILMLLAKGASNKEIARDLGVAESTVKIHVQGILRKLNLVSRVQAAVYAVEKGLLPAPGRAP